MNVTMAACFLRTHEFGDCGEFQGITEFASLDQCNNDLSQHLFWCHLSPEQITEGGLILAHSGLFYTTEAHRGEMFVCPKHRAYIGQYWGNQTKVKVLQVPWAQGRAQSSQDWSGNYVESIKGSDGNVWCSCSCWCMQVSSIKFFSNFLFERIETLVNNSLMNCAEYVTLFGKTRLNERALKCIFNAF